jgi:intraflagellar transport protein 172
MVVYFCNQFLHSRLIQNNPEMLHNEELVAKVASALLHSELFEQAGELYEKVNQTEKAFDCYRKAQAFARAIELARFVSPSGTELFRSCLSLFRSSRILMNLKTTHFI